LTEADLKLLFYFIFSRLLFTLQSNASLWDSLAYSPDEHSLAGCTGAAIIIWDTQTGGVVGKIGCEVTNNGSELVWSLDGVMIGIISPLEMGSLTVRIYEVRSGTMQSSNTVKSESRGLLWAHVKSFHLMMTTKNYHQDSIVTIYEVGITLTKVEQFHFQHFHILGVFSPTTYRISISAIQHCDQGHQLELLILNVCNSEVLLQESGFYRNVTFSPDGNLVAASIGGRLLIWRYTSGSYIRWRELQQVSLI